MQRVCEIRIGSTIEVIDSNSVLSSQSGQSRGPQSARDCRTVQ